MRHDDLGPGLDPYELLSERAAERYRDYVESGRSREWIERVSEMHKERERKKRSVFAPGEAVS